MNTANRKREVSGKAVRLSRAQRAAVLKALSDPTRFEVLERIAKASCPLSCMEARDTLGIAPATLSHHLKELETAGLIETRREGKYVFLSLRPGILEALASTLNSRGGTCSKASPQNR